MSQKELSIGDVITFGHYEQKEIDEMCFLNEPIEWIVINISGVEAILLCLKAIMAAAFDDGESSYRGWKKSSIRNVLNVDFVNTAFSKEEKELLLESHITTIWQDAKTRNLVYESSDDYVFLLSSDELEKYTNTFNISSSADLMKCCYTEYAAAYHDGPDPCNWYLRNAEKYNVATAGENGFSSWPPSAYEDYPLGIRPVIKIRLDTGYDFEDRHEKVIATCHEIITQVDLLNNSCVLIITTEHSSFTAAITKQNWGSIGYVGGYWDSDSAIFDIKAYEGAILERIVLTETPLVPFHSDINKIRYTQIVDSMQYINFETSMGILQFVVYNFHNGNDEQDVFIKNGDTVIWKCWF